MGGSRTTARDGRTDDSIHSRAAIAVGRGGSGKGAVVGARASGARVIAETRARPIDSIRFDSIRSTARRIGGSIGSEGRGRGIAGFDIEREDPDGSR